MPKLIGSFDGKGFRPYNLSIMPWQARSVASLLTFLEQKKHEGEGPLAVFYIDSNDNELRLWDKDHGLYDNVVVLAYPRRKR